MANKKFVVFGGVTPVDKSELKRIQEDSETKLRLGDIKSDQETELRLAEKESLFHVKSRVVVKVDTLAKNRHTFEDGTVIRRERQYNEFNRRIAQPVNCIIISGEGLPVGGEILVSHNALHETNRINDYKQSFEYEETARVRYFSIPDYECFAWREPGGEWKPIEPFEFALRVFVPYRGTLEGIEPEQLVDTLYVTTGELAGNVVKTGKACDYQIVLQGDDGREKSLIRFRPFGDHKNGRPEEAECILHNETKQVKNGELLVGYEIKTAKKLV